MKDLCPLKWGRDEGTLHKIEWENGSWFLALSSGTRKLESAGKRAMTKLGRSPSTY